jgi:hypothetical protein
MQAHFTAASSERRKLMSAPLSSELRQKHSVSRGFSKAAVLASRLCNCVASRYSTESSSPAGNTELMCRATAAWLQQRSWDSGVLQR